MPNKNNKYFISFDIKALDGSFSINEIFRTHYETVKTQIKRKARKVNTIIWIIRETCIVEK